MSTCGREKLKHHTILPKADLAGKGFLRQARMEDAAAEIDGVRRPASSQDTRKPHKPNLDSSVTVNRSAPIDFRSGAWFGKTHQLCRELVNGLFQHGQPFRVGVATKGGGETTPVRDAPLDSGWRTRRCVASYRHACPPSFEARVHYPVVSPPCQKDAWERTVIADNTSLAPSSHCYRRTLGRHSWRVVDDKPGSVAPARKSATQLNRSSRR